MLLTMGENFVTVLSTSIELEDEELEQKPIIVKASFPNETLSKICQTAHIGGTKLTLQLPLDTTSSTNEVSYRVFPLKADHMDGISEGDIVPVTPILASALTDDHRLSLITTDNNQTTSRTVVVPGGQVFLLSEPTATITTTGRSFLPRPPPDQEIVQQPTLQNHRIVSSREEKRRVIHNEVERRRRDKINNWICKLASVLPEDKTFDIQKTTSQVSKGLILAKACEYIGTLQAEKETLAEKLMLIEEGETYHKLLQQEVNVLRDEIAALKTENTNLKAHIGGQADLKS